MKTKILMTIGLLIVLAAVLFFAILHKPKIGFIIISDVYEKFELKIELQKEYERTASTRKKILDSLEVNLSFLNQKLSMNAGSQDDKSAFERLIAVFQQKKMQYDEENKSLSLKYDEQILSQLNQYVSDFGKEEGYDIILGNASSGTIMYGKESLNISKDVISYINIKYQGSK